MTGTLIHHKGRNGEEAPLTDAQRNNQAIWAHHAKAQRTRKLRRNIAAATIIGSATAAATWTILT